MRILKFRLLHILFLTLLASACTGDYKKKGNQVVIRIPSDPETMNPAAYSDNLTGTISKNIFQSMLDLDFKTLKLIPVLAEKLPKVEITPEGKILITHQIRKEANWDNGSPVTADDVIFSLKAIKNPLVNSGNLRPTYENIEEIIQYRNDPRKFTVVFDTLDFLAEVTSGDFSVLPEYLYDSDHRMRKFSIMQLNREGERLSLDPEIISFANEFNSEKHMREKGYIAGSGAYRFVEWKTGQQLVLERKANWWGDKIKKENCYFEAYPEKLIYKIIPDQTAAVSSLKAGVVDVMNKINPKDFIELKKTPKFIEKFNTYTPIDFSYYYIGLNTKSPKLNDKRTRQAIAHLVNVDEIIKGIMYGLAEKSSGPIHPAKTQEYNPEIKPYNFDPEKARVLLAEAGWKNTNGDKTLDRIIDGKRVEFEIDMLINAGNDSRKQIAIMLKSEAEKVGIEINIVSKEWTVFIKNNQSHNFDITIGAWVSSPLATDLKALYHTESQLGGSNFVNFGTPESDMLLEKIKVEMNPDKRFPLYKRFQEIMHDDAACVFLYFPTERIAISKKITNAEASILRPGFWEAGFNLANDKE